jgi:RNA polymerase sigma-70 factor (ECF subfamily)
VFQGSTVELTLPVRFRDTLAYDAERRARFDLSEKPGAPTIASAAGPPLTQASTHVLDDVMDRYARGDDAAFTELFRVGAPRVRGFLLRLCLDRGLADDLTQETFLRVHMARGRFEQGAAALPWILAVARNAFLDSARHTRVRRKAVDAKVAGQSAEPEAPSSSRGDELLAAREMARVVEATLATMSVTLREAFVLIRFEGMSVAEAAQVLGASEAAVKVRAFRAYELLREALGPDVRGAK